MNHHLPDEIVVTHVGSVVALCTFDRVHFSRSIEALPDHHPDRVFVAAKCLVAGAIIRGEVEGPYDDVEAEEAARILVADMQRASRDRRGPREGDEHAAPGA